MAIDPQASFSPGRRWSMGLHVFLVIFAALAMVVMLNYVSRDYFLRLQWSTHTKIQLAPRTLSLLHSITNPVKVTLYYDKKDPFYTTVADLLNQYAAVNPKISIRSVDYVRDAGAAQNVKTDYKLVLSTEKNVVIFDCQGRIIRMDGDALASYIYEELPSQTEREFRRKPTAFEGETRFTAALLAVTSPAPLTAYFLQGHKEHLLDNTGDFGYHKFEAVLNENCVTVKPFSLLGTNVLDCNLLIIAGPVESFMDPELEKIENYLAQGGRALILFNNASLSAGRDKTGLEKVLAKWGVQVGSQAIKDPDAWAGSIHNLVARDFNQKHPLINPLLGSGLYLIRPRAIGKLKQASQNADAPRVDELAYTGERAVAGGSGQPQRFPLMVAVEKGAVQGVITERGATRLVIAGDSVFLTNAGIESAGNREFAAAAINWLLNRAQLLEGIGPQPIKVYKVVMSNSQWQNAQWILLGGMPGSVLTIGGLVWLRRRK